jgi:hypothetical protein
MSKPITVKTAPGTAGGQPPAQLHSAPLRRGVDVFQPNPRPVELSPVPPGPHPKVVVHHGR